jgi:hypothetical protein
VRRGQFRRSAHVLAAPRCSAACSTPTIGCGRSEVGRQSLLFSAKLQSRGPMQPRPDPRRRLIIAHAEHAPGRLDL